MELKFYCNGYTPKRNLMKYRMNLFILTFLSVLLIDCNNPINPKTSIAGNYSISAEFKNLSINKEKIQAEMNSGIQSMRKEMEDIDAKKELSTDGIDTSTAEGKIEYAAKNFAKGMTGFAGAMAEFGTSIAQMSLGAVDGLFNSSGELMKNFTADVELKEDGTFKASGNPILKFAAAQYSWDVSGDQFIIKNDKDEIQYQIKITEKSADGFTLANDQVKLICKKKPKTI